MIENVARGQQVFTSNAFLVTGERTVLVDAGSEFDAAGEVRDRDAALDAVVLTHTHPDHVGNTAALVDAFDCDVWGFDPDHELVDHAIADGDSVELGDHRYEALHTPGHKDDHLCLYAAGAEVLFAGDLVFANGSFGRTDLPEGDREVLIDSIEYLRDTVSPELAEMHTGHGPSVTDDPYDHIETALRAAKF
ncbi:MBL fold metallo-hydrolase [Halosimplex pelagicum]|uniref:MBL fold metallo-hydrolase n=1 Tax=Halosimplex pelagicum TaxID=869886 RepID=A0A7D5P958_9EURY|nr:MBL fold metallo-hydrolase [Halosimplex pelagicum]QLH83906.1 MBL fold metallo-hydrolase [Halosimplex pelagicum]